MFQLTWNERFRHNLWRSFGHLEGRHVQTISSEESNLQVRLKANNRRAHPGNHFKGHITYVCTNVKIIWCKMFVKLRSQITKGSFYYKCSQSNYGYIKSENDAIKSFLTTEFTHYNIPLNFVNPTFILTWLTFVHRNGTKTSRFKTVLVSKK